ncbi:MAG: hypothetical protein ACRCS6_00920 [Turicibacter sp.]
MEHLHNEITIKLPKKLWNHEQSMSYLTQLNNQLKTFKNTMIRVSFSQTVFIQPNILAILGCILDDAKPQGNTIVLIEMKPKIKKLLYDYQFIRTQTKTPCHYISYQTFNQVEKDNFLEYLTQELSFLPSDSSQFILSRAIELFENATRHSQNENLKIYMCGYCNLNQDWLYLSIVNKGNTFYDNVPKVFKTLNLIKQYEAIQWGCFNGHSSVGAGGIGLSMIEESIRHANGFLWILSGLGYYDSHKQVFKEFEDKFDGTVITIGIPLMKLHESDLFDHD